MFNFFLHCVIKNSSHLSSVDVTLFILRWCRIVYVVYGTVWGSECAACDFVVFVCVCVSECAACDFVVCVCVCVCVFE